MRPNVTEAQLRRIYGETIDALYAYVSRRCGGVREVAEDIVQETWLRAVRHWSTGGVPNIPLAWLTSVARNLIIDQLRKHDTVSLDSVAATDLLAALEADDGSDLTERATLVNEALGRLPPAEARLIEAFHYDKFKTVQIAQLYGISERAVEGRLRRARERLRRELDVTMKIERGMP
jgi:RNA polymerase sigma-70 factor (ECF subfamily)